jgi:hypothetical protein
MQRVLIVLLVVAVAILAWRDRQRERRLAELGATVAQLDDAAKETREAFVRDVTAKDQVAKILTGATLGQFISDPLKRQIGLDIVNMRFDDAARRKSLEPLCTRMHMNGMFPPLCNGVGIAVAPEPMPKGLDVE